MRYKWKLSKRSFNFSDDNWMYFPYAEKFMEKFPWLAVRVFYVLIKIKEFYGNFTHNSTRKQSKLEGW